MALALASEVWLPQLAAPLYWIILFDFVEYFLCSGYQVSSLIRAAVQYPRLLLVLELIAAYLPPRSLTVSSECSVFQHMAHILSSCPITPLLRAPSAS